MAGNMNIYVTREHLHPVLTFDDLTYRPTNHAVRCKFLGIFVFIYSRNLCH